MTQNYLPIAGSLVLSSLVAAIPILVAAFMLGVMKASAWRAAALALTSAIVVAVVAYRMPVPLVLTVAAYGGAFGWMPIGWLVFSAILLFDVTVASGSFDAIKASLQRVSGDPRLLVLLIAFCFGAFIEGTSGFATPVALSASLLAALGLPPFRAAALSLIANTAPVAFGALGTPIVTLAGVTSIPISTLSAAVGRLCPMIAVAIPMYMMVLMSGWRGAQGVWPAAVLSGVSFGLAQFLVSNYIGPYLTDVIAALVAALVLLVFLRMWKPADSVAGHTTAAPVAAGSPMSLVRAWTPYLVLILFVTIWGMPWSLRLLDAATVRIEVPLLHNVIVRMPPVTAAPSPYPAVFVFNWLATAGTATFLAAFVSGLLGGVGPVMFGRLMVKTFKRLFVAELTFFALLGLAYVMNYSGATATLGLLLAGTGFMFPFFSAFLGWLGVFLTGSDTSANALFGNLQVISAQALGLNPVLMAAANSSAGVLGKMVSLQSIAVATAATGMSREDEAGLFRYTLRHSLALTAVMGLIIMLCAYVFVDFIPRQ